MQEYQTTDARSIANAIAETMAAAGIGVRVENFGAPTFQSSLELIKFVTVAARADRLATFTAFLDRAQISGERKLDAYPRVLPRRVSANSTTTECATAR